MRLVSIPSRHLIKLYNGMYETTMTGSIIIKYQPSEEYHLVSKQYVDNIVNNIDFSKLEVSINRHVFPETQGDFNKDKDGNYVLKPNDRTVNGGAELHPNKNGLMTFSDEKINQGIIQGKLDSKIIDKSTLPNTPEGVGIRDAIKLDGTGYTLVGFKTDIETMNYKDVITPGRERKFYERKVEYKVGDIVLLDPGQIKGETDFLKLESQYVDKSEFPELFDTIGYKYSTIVSNCHGKPWKGYNLQIRDQIQPDFNPTEIDLGLPVIGGHDVVVTNNKVFVLGGYNGDFSNIYDSIYMADVNNGVLGKFRHIGKMPVKRTWHKCLVFDNRLFIFGGTSNPRQSEGNSFIYSTGIQPDGSLKMDWTTHGNLNREFLNPIIMTTGGRVNIFGGSRFKSYSGNTLTHEENDVFIWATYNPITKFSNWLVKTGREYILGDCDLLRGYGGYYLYEVNVKTSYNNPLRNGVYNFKSDRINISGRGSSNAMPNSVTIRTIEFSNGVMQREDETHIEALIFHSLYDGGSGNGFYQYSRQTTHRGGGWRMFNGVELSKINRDYFETLLLKDKAYIIGGLSGNRFMSYARETKQPEIVINLKGTGLDNYSERYNAIPYDPERFRLPLLDSVAKGGKVYDYYIKAR